MTSFQPLFSQLLSQLEVDRLHHRAVADSGLGAPTRSPLAQRREQALSSLQRVTEQAESLRRGELPLAVELLALGACAFEASTAAPWLGCIN